MRIFKDKRRQKLRTQPVPSEWAEILRDLAPLYGVLPESDRLELHGHVHVFLDEKRFEGCDGMEITDEVRVTIAAQACLLLLHRDTDYFPGLHSILVYPAEYVAPVVEDDGDVITEYAMDRTGETWGQGSLVLSWQDVLSSGHDAQGAYNVVLHEFAHQLDLENGELDGVPRITDTELASRWREVMTASFIDLQKRSRAGRSTIIDDYGSDDPAEFFAVSTEAFFEAPAALAANHAELYDVLKTYYKQDPAAW